MNEVLNAIARRRSVRKYGEKQVQEPELRAILEAGLQAPSAHNDQSWYFLAVQDGGLIREISEGSKAEMRKAPVEWVANAGRVESFDIFYRAPTVILAAARKDAVAPAADVCAALENMMIAAESLGLGSCWIGFARYYFSRPDAGARVGLPEGYEVHYAMTLGYKADPAPSNPPVRKYESYYRIIK